jgi:threonyl-tRNA synthetase
MEKNLDEDGFYYDFDFSTPPSEKDLPKIEKKMREILKSWDKFESKEVSAEEAKKIFKDNPYKTELIEEIKERGEKITLYTSGRFTDLCRGGHVDSMKEIDPAGFKLDRVAGAYWRGSEKNKMLTRIYGLAFETKKALADYILQREEAEKRDHRKIGKEMEIFAFDNDVGAGLALWLPNGTIIAEELENLAKETEFKAGYVRVKTPHVAKESLYLTSGHLPYYKDSMYPPMEYEGEKYYLKAMNCPHHHKIYAARPRSYRELPLRMAEYGTVYRHEKSGELFGIMRVRGMHMNDAHIYCTKEQFARDFEAVNEMYLKYFKIFGVEKYIMRFSTHDPKKLGEKYVNEPALWKETEDLVRKVLIDSKIPYVEIADEAAFYGPKIDVQIFSAIGREFTLATNQVDFSSPRRFDLKYTTPEGKDEYPLIIHRAPLGTHERFIGFLIEHYGGHFPTWLAPTQVAVLNISENQEEYGREIADKLHSEMVRVKFMNENESLGKKIRKAKMERTPYIIVVGDKEKEAKTMNIESRAQKYEGMELAEFLKIIKSEIKERR